MAINLSEIILTCRNGHTGKLARLGYMRGFGCAVCGAPSTYTDEWIANSNEDFVFIIEDKPAETQEADNQKG